MTRHIGTLLDAADSFDVAVLDQWGVLHDGTSPYPSAIQALHDLNDAGKRIVVLSNSGKRSDLNRQRIAGVGIPVDPIDHVMTSGEAVWQDLTRVPASTEPPAPRTILPLCAAPGDAAVWLGDASRISLTDSVDAADALLLMGLPDNSPAELHDPLFEQALARDLPCLCSNPDKLGIRAGGMVRSPGQLADRYEQRGGTVVWYGKPYPAVYDAVKRLYPDTPAVRFLMVGDSLEHDIAGGNTAGMQTAFVRGGIHADTFNDATDPASALLHLTRQQPSLTPTYSLAMLA